MLIIIAVVSCASILEASGCLKCMLQYAERVLRKDPKKITFFGAMVTYALTLMSVQVMLYIPSCLSLAILR